MAVLLGEPRHLSGHYDVRPPCWDGEGRLAWSHSGGNWWQFTLELRNSQPHLAVWASKTLWAEISNHPHPIPNHPGLNIRVFISGAEHISPLSVYSIPRLTVHVFQVLKEKWSWQAGLENLPQVRFWFLVYKLKTKFKRGVWTQRKGLLAIKCTRD